MRASNVARSRLWRLEYFCLALVLVSLHMSTITQQDNSMDNLGFTYPSNIYDSLIPPHQENDHRGSPERANNGPDSPGKSKNSGIPQIKKTPKSSTLDEYLQELESVGAKRPPLEPYPKIFMLNPPSQKQSPVEKKNNGTTTNHLQKRGVVCACAKCGSSSFFRALYEGTFHQPWNLSGRPYIHNVDSERWNGVGSRLQLSATNNQQQQQQQQQKQHFDEAFSFAIIRDPKERIISAWKNKINCGKRTPENKVDTWDREKFVPQLLKLASKCLSKSPVLSSWMTIDENKTCLTLEEYLRVLFVIHHSEQEWRLNEHFLPQHLGCFRHWKPNKWSVVSTVGKAGMACQLRNGLFVAHGEGKNTTDGCDFPHHHASKMKIPELSPDAQQMLELITAQEYESLGDYL